MIASMAFIMLATTSPEVDQAARSQCEAVSKAQVARMKALADGIEADAQYAETHNNEFSPEMIQRYVVWYRKQQSAGKNYPALHLTKLSASEQIMRQRSIDAFLDYEKAERDTILSDFRKTLIQACPWRAAEIKARSWPEGL